MAKRKKSGRKPAKRRTGGKRRKMTAAEKRAFVRRMERARGVRVTRKGSKRAKPRRGKKGTARRRTSRGGEKGLRHRVAKLEKFATAQKHFNHKTKVVLGHVAHGLDKVFRHTGLSMPKGIHAPSLTKQLGG